MCGIAGILYFNKNKCADSAAVSTTVRRMTDAMVHRGPDGDGVWVSDDGCVALGHRRLSIIDLSLAGKQPMVTPDKSVVLTFNGEIYNYRHLRSALEQQGIHFQSSTDTETLLYLYRQQGAKAVESLEGDFAFAIWDAAQKKLVLARDRAGVKPLYYFCHDDFFVFASEIGALLASGLVPREVDEVSLHHYLTYLVAPSGRTMVRGVRKLDVASLMTVSMDGRMDIGHYWDCLPQQPVANTGELDEEFQALFKESVDKRMMSDVPLGVLFSGGVDSTLNAGAFKERVPSGVVNSFTVGMPDTPQDESVHARKMAKILGLNHHEIMVDEDTVLDALPTIAAVQDEPLGDPVCLPLYFVSKLARESGTTVLQAGEGADELFAGYRSTVKYMAMQKKYWQPLQKLPVAIPRMMSCATGMAAQMHGSANLFLATDVLQRLSYGREFFLSSAIGFYETEKGRFLKSSFQNRMENVDAYDVVHPLYDRLEESAPHASFLQKMTYLQLHGRLPELLLMRVDKMSMAHSLEVRVPFLDHKLIDFAMRVPDDWKLRDGIPKEPVKRMAATYAPRDEIYKTKKGFGAPILPWMQGRLGREMRDVLQDPSYGAEDYFDVDFMLKRLDQGVKTTREAFQFWLIHNFLLWKKYKLQD